VSVVLQAARPLPEVLEQLREKGLRRGVDAVPGVPSAPAVPTGQPALDAALRTGGWPRGSLSFLDAPAGSGGVTLALGSLAATQERGGIVAWIDGDGSFDPATAQRLGVRLEWLLLVRPSDAAEGVELAAWLTRSHLIDTLVLDLAGPAMASRGAGRGLERLPQLMARAASVALLLAGGSLREAAARSAGIRLELERQAWLAVGNDLVGQRVTATVERHRWATPGGQAELDLWFAEGRRIDPLLPALAVPSDATIETARPALRILSA
jgi:recombination protein RecA